MHPEMTVKNHRIPSIWYKQTSNLSSGRTLNPSMIVMHYTTGWNGEGSRNWLMGAAGGTSNEGSSAHVVIDRDGTAWQIAPFNRVAWHAGPSRYGDLESLNNHAIGLEFVNSGPLSPDGDGQWIDPYGHRRSDDELNAAGGFIKASHPRVGGLVYAWPNYTKVQLATGYAILKALADQYPISAIVSHEEIDTRGWKTDPGPAFPMESFRQLLGDRNPAPRVKSVTASRLNIRKGPGVGYARIDPPGALDTGTIVRVLSADDVWRLVEVNDGPLSGVRGWVHGAYLG
ncbi:N-acetylmuramoyl-L-alanine amidase [Martelella mediterranea]|uniref:N-acetylmuramoyl-L-alanine amidase n=1 Tax=Martelella mediterranea TaxID=293089 RepID=A0A4R3NPK4_9HYPH|nr:N-acetylmuramoyl-L-alanine amidase [Martelella mediterranea]TCT37681.1 N-acetylmuramoyl-L-alanine amidase [Martelella mediterranea]